MRRRIFIAINLPKEIKSKLYDFRLRWPELPIRWTKPENLHITLIFLGYLSDDELLEVINTTKQVCQRNKSFLINLNKVCYGPSKKKNPRMIWVEGEKSKGLKKLRSDLENSLMEGVNYSLDERSFSPHITLGRIKMWEFRQIPIEERPDVSEDISFSFEVNSVEVMESQLKRGGSEYSILESFPLLN